MDKPNKLSFEDWRAIQDAKTNASFLQILLEKAQLEKFAGDLQVKNLTLMAFLKYGLTGNDSIDNDGNIVRLASVEPDGSLVEVIDETPPTPVSTKKKKVA